MQAARIDRRVRNATTTATMPPAKRVKSSAKSSGAARPAAGPERPTTDDVEGESEFATLARQHWLKTAKRSTRIKVKNDVLKREIWDALERDDFPLKSLLVLEGLQTLERYGPNGELDASSLSASMLTCSQLPMAWLQRGVV
jgi:intron-binding protein aquarius